MLVEGACVIFGWGTPSTFEDPFVGFDDVRPLFVLNDDSSEYFVPKSRRRFFAEESFPVQKKPNTFRIFCLGGSTVQGRPFSTPTAFSTWLKIRLETTEPDKNWEVANCGGISYASYRLIPILKECLNYQPNLFILCTGHNEFLEERTYGHIKHVPQLFAAPRKTISKLRSYQLVRQVLVPDSPQQKPKLSVDSNPLLDYHNGIKAYHRDENWRAGVIQHYESNLQIMLAIAHKARVPVLLMKPCSNLSDSPPFKSEHRGGFSAEEQKTWNTLMQQARSHYKDNMPAAVSKLQQAIELDPLYASTHYALGKTYETLGERKLAKAAFLQARELDVCPLRIISPMEQAIESVVMETGTPFLDLHALLESECPDNILGDFLLVDHVHPSFRGHQLVADAIAKIMERQGWHEPHQELDSEVPGAYLKHFESLENTYFQKGRQTLENLRLWTQGRAEGPDIETRKTNTTTDE